MKMGYSKCAICGALVYVKNNKYYCGVCQQTYKVGKEK